MNRLLALGLYLLLTGCTQQAEPVFNNQVLAFGTIIDITIDGVEPAHAEQVSSELEQMFLQWHHEWHAWEDGPLTQLNAQLASGKPATVDAGLLPLLIEANRLSELSNGLFNPLIGGLLGLWGFQGKPLPDGTLPDPDAIRDWLAQAPVVADINIK
ncbi:MAG: FAD:protein FMN transferase, partial [Gammaproteobacteria bacterium]|nr:FAD:protein FMN transferase [Gammaproteobacteria bacterium]